MFHITCIKVVLLYMFFLYFLIRSPSFVLLMISVNTRLPHTHRYLYTNRLYNTKSNHITCCGFKQISECLFWKIMMSLCLIFSHCFVNTPSYTVWGGMFINLLPKNTACYMSVHLYFVQAWSLRLRASGYTRHNYTPLDCKKCLTKY